MAWVVKCVQALSWLEQGTGRGSRLSTGLAKQSSGLSAPRIVLFLLSPELAGAGLPALASICLASPRNCCFCRGDLSAWRVQVFYIISLKHFKNLCLQG